MDFKVTYLDAGLTSNYMSDGETNGNHNNSGGGGSSGASPSSVTKVPKRYKTHLREFLSTSRGKRKGSGSSTSPSVQSGGGSAAAAAAADPSSAAAAAAAAAVMYPESIASYASVYSAAQAGTPYAAAAGTEYLGQQAAGPYIYSENRYFPSSADYLASYRSLTSYYPDYHQYSTYFDASTRAAAVAAQQQPPPPLTSYDRSYFDGGGNAGEKGDCKGGKGNKDSKGGVKCEPVSVVYDYMSAGQPHQPPPPPPGPHGTGPPHGRDSQPPADR